MRSSWALVERNWISPAWSSFDRLLGVVGAHRGLLALVSALLVVDLFWIVYFGVGRLFLEIGFDHTLYNHSAMLLTTEGGFPEWFNYAKTLIVVVLLVRLARTTRQPIYASLAFVFVIVVLDDGMQIHETFGEGFVRWLGIPRRLIGLRDHDVGEVIVWAIIGAIVLPLVLLTLARSRPRHRGNGLAILLAFAALLVCAVLVDQLYASFNDAFLLAGLLIDMGEDGGELLAITLACALALGAWRECAMPEELPGSPQVGATRTVSNRLSSSFLVAAVFLVSVAFAVLTHLPALLSEGIYKADTLQSPHWSAYHLTSFRADDWILRYASFNESPLQNAIYWVGTWFVEHLALSKILSVVSYGLLSAFFFIAGRAMFGVRFGLLLALFITAFPDQWDYSAGFFSKFWAIPLLLGCVFLLQTERWKGLIGLLPFGAIAYPTVSVLIGLTTSIYWIQELFRDRTRASRLFRCLAIGSALAVAILAVKYAFPPEGIGPMRPGAELRSMPEVQEHGYPSRYIPIPSLTSALGHSVVNPFVVLCAVLFFLILGRKRIAWERSWTALFLASAIGYILADVFFFRLYIPNRYTRYSLALLLALWSARNWDLILATVRSRGARCGLVLVLVLTGACLHIDSYSEGRGLSDRRRLVPTAWFVNTALPDGILVAGSPKWLDDLMIQGKRSVLCPYRLAHPWFTDYYDQIRERTRATLRAHFAADPGPINELHQRYGATHFLVEKELFERARLGERLFARPYNEEIYADLGERREFFLDSPTPRLSIWEDEFFAVLELPIPAAAPATRPSPYSKAE